MDEIFFCGMASPCVAVEGGCQGVVHKKIREGCKGGVHGSDRGFQRWCGEDAR